MKKAIVVLALLLVVGIVAAVVGVHYLAPPRSTSESGTKTGEADTSEVLVTVNGTGITRNQMDHQADLIARQRGIPDTPESQSQSHAMLEPMALKSLITQTLLKQVAVKENIAASLEEVEKEMNEIRQGFPSPEAFAQRLKELGLDEAKLRQEIAEGMMMQKLVTLHTRQEGAVTDEDVQKFYESHPEMLTNPETIRASHILIGFDEKDTDETKAAKKKQAEDILAQLKKGGAFAELAKQYSTCPSKQQGGDLGYFPRGQMVKPFEDAVFALKVGQLSGVVETQFGYHLIKKTDQKPAGLPPLAEVKDQIRKQMQQQKERGAFENYLTELKGAAAITYSDAAKQMGVGQPTDLPPGHPSTEAAPESTPESASEPPAQDNPPE